MVAIGIALSAPFVMSVAFAMQIAIVMVVAIADAVHIAMGIAIVIATRSPWCVCESGGEHTLKLLHDIVAISL